MFRSPPSSPTKDDSFNMPSAAGGIASRARRIHAVEKAEYPGYIFYDRGEVARLANGLILDVGMGKSFYIFPNVPYSPGARGEYLSNFTPNTFSAEIFVGRNSIQAGINVIFNQANPFYFGDDPLKANNYIKLGADERAQHIWYPSSDPRSTPNGLV